KIVVARSDALVPVVVPVRASIGSQNGVPKREVLRGVIGSSFSASQRCSVSARQISPRPFLAMKLIASGVTFSAAIARSPSFSRSSSSTRTIIRPCRISSTASSTVANGGLCSLISPHPFQKQLIKSRAHQPRARNRKDPGPHNPFGHAPAHGGQPPRRAYPGDCSRNHVRRAHGYARRRRPHQR